VEAVEKGKSASSKITWNTTSSEVEAVVPLVVRGVTEKHTPSRTRCQLMRSSGGGVRVTRCKHL
jgi:hypothetical protein